MSRSSELEKACGLIGSDVFMHELKPTSDPSVYATDYFASWTSKPGTYFWQAYRVEYRDGADGCIDSEVRSLVIKAAAPTPTPKPKPTPTPPKPKAPGALHRGGSAAGGGRHVSMRFDAPPTSAAQGLGPISSSAERARSCTSWRRASTSPS